MITVKDLIRVCNGKLLCGDINAEIKDPFISSLEAVFEGTFFGVGNNYKYYKDALEKKASVCVLPFTKDINLRGFNNVTIVMVKDVLEAMRSLAAYKRRYIKNVIGITGSVGKTTTSNIIKNMLKSKYKVLCTQKNRNGQIGVPLTILSVKDEDVLVLEMGISKEGEMEKLSLIAKPNIVVVTNIYSSHVENFGDRKKILKEKLKIINNYTNYVIVNNDNDLLRNYKYKEEYKVIRYSINNDSNYKALNVVDDKISSFDCNNISNIKVNGPKDIIYNILAAICVSKLFNIDDTLIKDNSFLLDNEEHRLSVIKNKYFTIIDDSYNSSLESVYNALNYLDKFKENKIVILGDILEINNYKETYNLIANKLNEYKIELLITVGDKSKIINKYYKGKSLHFKNEELVRRKILKLISKDSVILIKGSNRIKLFNIVNYLNNL